MFFLFISVSLFLLRTKKLYKEREEILLISPVQDAADSGEEGRSIMTRSTRATSRRVTTKHEKSKLVVQSLIKTTKNSYRMGPLGKTKKK